jgi:hypothetical protein
MSRRRSAFAIVCCLAGAAAPVLARQNTPVTVRVDLRVAGSAYAVTAAGECHATDDASIFNAPAALKSARQSDPSRSLSLTLWRLVKGGDAVTLDVTLGGKRHRVNTLTVGPASNRAGSGTATFQARGAGGVFTVDATADSGARITGQVSCSRFDKPEENG